MLQELPPVESSTGGILNGTSESNLQGGRERAQQPPWQARLASRLVFRKTRALLRDRLRALQPLSTQTKLNQSTFQPAGQPDNPPTSLPNLNWHLSRGADSPIVVVVVVAATQTPLLVIRLLDLLVCCRHLVCSPKSNKPTYRLFEQSQLHHSLHFGPLNLICFDFARLPSWSWLL